MPVGAHPRGGFHASRSQRRVLKRNAYLQRDVTSAWATEDQYALFRRYLDHRHTHGGMADMDVFEYSAMVEETPVRTRVLEYRDVATGPTGPLVAACLSDVLEDGLSLVYSFFDPALSSQSLGSYMILDQIDLARRVGLPYVYLGIGCRAARKWITRRVFRARGVSRRPMA